MAGYVQGLLGWRRWARTALWRARVEATARVSRATLDLDVDPTAVVGPGVHVRTRHGTSNRLRIGPGCRLERGTMIHLADGAVELGPGCELRSHVVLNVSGGTVSLAGHNILSWGTTIHAAEEVSLGDLTSCSEYVTIADSRHFHTDEGQFFYHNTESRPVRIGRNVWLASKATVTMGSDIGDCAVVAANSVVAGAVPPGTLVAGAPARPIRPTLEGVRDAGWGPS